MNPSETTVAETKTRTLPPEQGEAQPLATVPPETDIPKPTGSKLTPEQIFEKYGMSETDYAVLLQTVCKDAPREIAAFFMRFCFHRKLDPYSKQVYLWPDDTEERADLNGVVRRMPVPGCTWSIVTSIGGLRAIASRSPYYRGRSPKRMEFEKDEAGAIKLFEKADSQYGKIAGKRRPTDCTITVYRAVPQAPTDKSLYMEFESHIRFDEYVKRLRNGQIYGNWEVQPEHQFEKCNEADALRMGFPEEVGGIYIEEEMGHVAAQRGTPAATEEPELPKEILELAEAIGWELPMVRSQLKRYGTIEVLQEAMVELRDRAANTSRAKAQRVETIDQPPENVTIATVADPPAALPPEETFQTANFDTAPGSITDKTRRILFGALGRRDIHKPEDRHEWADYYEIDISPREGAPNPKPSFANLSEADAQKFLSILTVCVGKLDDEKDDWRDVVLLLRCDLCGARQGEPHGRASSGEICPIEETDEPIPEEQQ